MERLETLAKLSKDTKKAKSFINAFDRSNLRSIYDAYEKPSRYKQLAFENIVRYSMQFYDKFCVSSVFIISYNTCCFTTAYTLSKDNKKWLIVDTKSNVYCIEL